MNILLPYPNLRLSAHVLDTRTLGTQITECAELVRQTTGNLRRGFISLRESHSLGTQMWLGYTEAVALHLAGLLEEVAGRGYPSELPSPHTPEGMALLTLPEDWASAPAVMPPWLGHERLHASHRAYLLSADTAWYQQWAWDEPPLLDLWMPGPLPSVGDSVVSPEGAVFIVRSQLGNSFDCIMRAQAGREVLVHPMEFYMRRWLRAVDRS